MVVEHDAGARRFVARAGGRGPVLGHVAYARTGDGAFDLQHTVVDPSQRGQGLGEELVRQTLALLRAEAARVTASCPFVSAYLDAHPDERDPASAP